MEGLTSAAGILAGMGIGTTSAQAQAEDSERRRLTAREAKIYFGTDYHDGAVCLTSAEAIEEKILLRNSAPEPSVCEHCQKTLYHLGLFHRGGLDNYKRRMPDEIWQWSAEPERCDCETATAAWEAHDAEIRRQKEERQRKEDEERHRKRVEAALGNSGIKQRFLSRTFENFVRDTLERSAAYKTAKSYADNFKRHLEAGQGLYIEGTFGTGKTHLAAAIALDLIEAEYRVVLKTADDLFRDIKRTFDEGEGGEHKIIEKYKTCDLLVIDDLGKEQATDWTTAMLYAIINDRYERQKPIIVTTNFSENDLIAIESPRGVGEHRIRAILSRLHETTATMAMAWKDWREG